MRTVEWVDGGKVKMIDQRELPWQLVYQEYETYHGVITGIKDMVIRGAPAIGAAGAFGMALAAHKSETRDVAQLKNELEAAARAIIASRPTAVNLQWAVDKMLAVARDPQYPNVDAIRVAVRNAANALAEKDVETNKLLGAHGSLLIRDGDTVLHHCNTGSLAAVDQGTALGAIRTAHEDGKKVSVLLCETRPRMQGSRLSAWELDQLKIPFEVIPDTAAGYYMQKGDIKMVFVGADRIAQNGDTANKIGTYQLAVLAKENWIPFYVVAPTSTVDMACKSGQEIQIEERPADEVRAPYGLKLMPDRFPVRNPAFDITPYSYITGIVTEHGIVKPPFFDNLKKVVK